MIILLIAALHLVLSFTYALDFRYERGNLQTALLRFVLCFFLPVFGFVFLLFSDYYANRKEKIKGREENDFLEKELELELLKALNPTEEINKIPIIEALQSADYAYRRKVIMDTLKEENSFEYIGVLRRALENEDQETSHYASSVIMDIQGKLQNSLVQKEKEFQEHPENMEHAKIYETELYQVIQSGMYDKRDLQKYYVRYKVLSDCLFEQEDRKEELYHNRISVDFETGDFTHASKVCADYKLWFPSSEEMVVDYMKLYIYTKDKEGMSAFLEELKHMPVMLTAHSLQYIRFFIV